MQKFLTKCLCCSSTMDGNVCTVSLFAAERDKDISKLECIIYTFYKCSKYILCEPTFGYWFLAARSISTVLPAPPTNNSPEFIAISSGTERV